MGSEITAPIVVQNWGVMKLVKLVDLVEREAIKDAIGFMNLHFLGHGENKSVLDSINEVPSVDAVPVVRCKDCIHWYEAEGACLKIYSDGAVSPYAWQDRNPDDFCSYGEKRGDSQ